MKSVYLFDEADMDSISPQWWLNFVDSANRFIDVHNVNETLVEHKAKFVINGSLRWVEFEAEADYTMFILRFS